jgi:cysteine desulfurase
VIYLDANATTPLADEVWEAMEPWLRQYFHNPSSTHQGGKRARAALEEARGIVAEWWGAREDEVIFTSGGTEAVNALLAGWDSVAGEGYFLTSEVEHSAVLRSGQRMQRGMICCGVDSLGTLRKEEFAAKLKGAAFASVMAANNETGVILDWRGAAELAHSQGVPFFCDAVQAAGKIPLNVGSSAVDAMAISAHKFHGPKGSGALYVRRGCQFVPMLYGGGQEMGRRSGTENVAAIVGLAAAVKLSAKKLSAGAMSELAILRDVFEASVMQGIEGVVRNGDIASRLPNTSHLSFAGCEAAGLLILLDDMGVACSAGSACMAGKQKPSHVQMAMGLSEAQAKSSLRVSFSTINTMSEAQGAAMAVIRAVKKLRSVQGSGVGPVVIYTP